MQGGQGDAPIEANLDHRQHSDGQAGDVHRQFGAVGRNGCQGGLVHPVLVQGVEGPREDALGVARDGVPSGTQAHKVLSIFGGARG